MLDFLKLSLNNLRRRQLRSWLTMIGIFIGIAAVVSLISLGEGLQDAINEQFEQLGKDKIIVQPKSLGPPGSSTGSIVLTSKDLEEIKDVRGVDDAVGMLMKAGAVSYKDETKVIFVIGLEPEEQDILGDVQSYNAVEGRLLKGGDSFKVVVGNNHVFGELWEEDLELRNSLEISGKEFKVVGVLEKVGNPFDDNSVTIPKKVMRELFDIPDEESQIVVKTSEGFDPFEVADDIERALRKSRDEEEGQETFSVQTSEQLLESFSNIFDIVQGVLVGIAGISLLVGGIGIMNTMYTSVLERTKEIGTMKAIGARNDQILMLFLFESGLLGLVGGAIGVLLGIGLAKGAEVIVSAALGTDLIRASINPWIIFGALAFSFVIGALSGILPAKQASDLRPVDALRYE